MIEAIDIGGVSLLRAAAKNYHAVAALCAPEQGDMVARWLQKQAGGLTLADRQYLATQTFHFVTAYDTAIWDFFQRQLPETTQETTAGVRKLRYGENPHQTGFFYGDLTDLFHQHQGKSLSYTNLLDIDSALRLLREWKNEPACVIVKHTTPCGVGLGASGLTAFQKAYAVDATSSFGGVFALNRAVDEALAIKLAALFYEVLVAPAYTEEALHLLSKKKRIVLSTKRPWAPQEKSVQSVLHGLLAQTPRCPLRGGSRRLATDDAKSTPCLGEKALLLGYKIAKHAKSNSIVLTKGDAVLGIGSGQPSRVDALKMALEKAKRIGSSLQGASMASEAFFPFPDCVEMAYQAGIRSVVQPGVR